MVWKALKTTANCATEFLESEPSFRWETANQTESLITPEELAFDYEAYEREHESQAEQQLYLKLKSKYESALPKMSSP